MRARGRADLLLLRDPILTVDLDLEDIFFFRDDRKRKKEDLVFVFSNKISVFIFSKERKEGNILNVFYFQAGR